MEKIISLAILLIGMISFATAQTNTQATVTGLIEYTGKATADTVGGNVTTWNKPIFIDRQDAVLYYAKVKVTETAGFSCTIKLQGKYFAADSYTDITTITYGGAGTDTTAIFSEASTAIKYRYVNFLVTRTAGTGKVTFVKASFKR